MITQKKEQLKMRPSSLWMMSLLILAAVFIVAQPQNTQAQWTTNGNNINNTNTGNVGIGTTSPSSKLHIVDNGNIAFKLQSNTAAAEADLISNAANGGSWAIGTGWSSVGIDRLYLYDNKAGATRLVIDSAGNIGIGTTNPTKRLTVSGDIEVSGNINAKYQDVAEWVTSRQKLTPGTVVILDPQKPNQVITSTEAYDTRVAGVISEQPGLLLGEGGPDKVKVATTGRVRVKVDASRGAIKIGDLLVTSDVLGVAMKSEPINFQGRMIHCPGTIIGKALEPLENGRGEILVLLGLH
jgi:hypothetical protein